MEPLMIILLLLVAAMVMAFLEILTPSFGLLAVGAVGALIGAIPIGYRLAEDGQHLDEDPEEQKVIALVKRRRKSGKSLRAIDRELRKKGFTPRGGQCWHVQTLANIARG